MEKRMRSRAKERSKLMKFSMFFRRYMTVWVFASIFLGLAFGYEFPKLNSISSFYLWFS